MNAECRQVGRNKRSAVPAFAVERPHEATCGEDHVTGFATAVQHKRDIARETSECHVRFVHLLAFLAIVGCGKDTPNPSTARMIQEKNVVFVLSPEYDQRIAQLRLSPAEAARLAIEFRKRESPGQDFYILGHHWLLVGDSYVFSAPLKEGFEMSGIYVDGNTGAVRDVGGPTIYLADVPEWHELNKRASHEEIRKKMFPLSDSGDEHEGER